MLLLCTTLLPATLDAAEDIQLLTLGGDLIGVLPDTDAATQPSELIARYYAELDDDEQLEVASLRRSLLDLIPDYEVAFAAADTAEVNSVLSEVAYRWAVLRTFHAAHFTPEVCATVEHAYGEAYTLFR